LAGLMVFTFLNLPRQTVQIQIQAISLRGPTPHYVAIHGSPPPPRLCAQSRSLPLVCDSDELRTSDGGLLIAQIIRILQTREELLLWI